MLPQNCGAAEGCQVSVTDASWNLAVLLHVSEEPLLRSLNKRNHLLRPLVHMITAAAPLFTSR